MNIPQIDITSLLTAITVITGLVNGFQLGFTLYTDIKLKGFISYVLSLIFGVLFGLLHWFGLPGVEFGIVAALAASGLYKYTQNVGGK